MGRSGDRRRCGGGDRGAVRVGLTGGIGAGKSTVASFFAEFGALVIDTDELARQATLPGTPALAEIARRWPCAVRDGALDRAALAAIVFSDAAERERLNAIVHPVVRELARQRERASPQHRVVVHVVPLLFETGYAGGVDASVLVVAPEEQRIARSCARDGTTPDDVRRRMAAQMPVEEARRRADYTIENDGDRALLRERARQVYDRLLRAA